MRRRESRNARIGTLTLGHLLVDLFGGLLAPLIPALAPRLDVGIAKVAMVAAFAGFLVNFLQPVAGWVIHHLRRPFFLALGPVLAAVFCLLGVPSTVGWLLVLVAAGSVGVAAFHPEALLAAHEVSGEDEHVGVPFFLSGGFFGFSLGALVSTQWVERLGFASFPLLGLPAAGFLFLFFFTGLHRVSIHEETPFVEPPVKREPIGFGGVLVVGAFLATAMSILYVFLNVHLTAPGRFGEDGLRWGGWTLFLLGISSAIASYGWGMLGRRWGPFRVVTLSQMAYAPLLFFLLRAQSPTGLLLLAIPAGLLQGGAVFPVVATAARRSRGLTPGLRVGLMVGGCWGVGGLVSMGCGELLRRGVPVARLLDGVGIFALLAAASAVWLSRERREGRRRMKRNRCGDPSGAPAAAQATEPPAPPPDAQTTPAEPHAPDGPDAPGTGGA